MGERYERLFRQLHQAAPTSNCWTNASRYDLARLGAALKAGRDLQFYLGLQTLFDRYFIHSQGTFPNSRRRFHARCDGALQSTRSIVRAQSSFDLLSSFEFMSSTRRCSIQARCVHSCPAAT